MNLLMFKTPLFDRDDAMAGGNPYGPPPTNENGGNGDPQSQQQSDPQAERVAALENRIGQLTDAVGTLAQQRQTQHQTDQIRAAQQALNGRLQQAQGEVATAQKELAAAYENGDPTEIANATAKVGSASAKVTRAEFEIESFQNQQRQAQQQAQQTQQSSKVDTTNLNEWRNRNREWYGVDPDLTRAAHEIDAEIRKEGVLEVGSKEYFRALDQRVQRRFPDHFSGGANAGQTAVQRGGGGQNRNPSQSASRIPAAIADGYRRMGINMDDPDTVKSVLGARETAVQKGMLPEQPAQGRVIQR